MPLEQGRGAAGGPETLPALCYDAVVENLEGGCREGDGTHDMEVRKRISLPLRREDNGVKGPEEEGALRSIDVGRCCH